jgi:hypothetical protein
VYPAVAGAAVTVSKSAPIDPVTYAVVLAYFPRLAVGSACGSDEPAAPAVVVR